MRSNFKFFITFTSLFIIAILTCCVAFSTAGFAFAEDEEEFDVTDYMEWATEKKVVPYSEKEHDYAQNIAAYFERYGLKKDDESYLKKQTSAYDDEEYYYNVVGTVSSGKANADVIIVGTSYDSGKLESATSLYSISYSYGEDARHNYSGMIAFLETVKYFASLEQKPDYDVIFVAFGASLSDNEGCIEFFESLPDRIADRVKLYLNITSVTGGGDLYFYAGEVETDFSRSFRAAMNENGATVKDTPANKHVGIDPSAVTYDGRNYPYSHLGLSDEVAIASQHGFFVGNLISGDWKTRSISAQESAVDLKDEEKLAAVIIVSNALGVTLADKSVMEKAFTDEAQAAKINYDEVQKQAKLYQYLNYAVKGVIIIALIAIVLILRKRKIANSMPADEESEKETNAKKDNDDPDVFGGNERPGEKAGEDPKDDDVFSGF